MNLNIREFPDGLWRRLKVEAAKSGVSLRELVIDTLSGVSWSGTALVDSSTKSHTTKPKATRKRAVAETGEPLPKCEHGRDASICLACDYLRRAK